MKMKGFEAPDFKFDIIFRFFRILVVMGGGPCIYFQSSEMRLWGAPVLYIHNSPKHIQVCNNCKKTFECSKGEKNLKSGLRIFS